MSNKEFIIFGKIVKNFTYKIVLFVNHDVKKLVIVYITGII